MLQVAREFLEQFYQGNVPAERWLEIEYQVGQHGTYSHTREELEFGARLAWRNSARCIGRLAWKKSGTI